MDIKAAEKIVADYINEAHTFGEGVGGSGHMASTGLSSCKVKAIDEATHNQQPCTRIAYSYEVTRMSEFGGETYGYEGHLLVQEGKAVWNEITTEYVRDLLAFDDDES